jgi:hypothetical protein
MSKFKYVRAALEDTGVPGEIGPMDNEIIQTLDVIETAKDEQDEIQDMVVAVEEEAANIEELENVKDLLGEVQDQDAPVSAVAAESINLHLKSILSRLVLTTPSSKRIPSTESYQRTASRVNVQVALESVTETIKKAWEAMKNFFKSIWQKVQAFFAKFFQNTDKLRKRAKDIKAAILDKTAGNKPKEDKYANSGIISCFTSKGDCDFKTTMDILVRHTMSSSVVPQVADAAKKTVKMYFEGLVEINKGLKDTTATLKDSPEERKNALLALREDIMSRDLDEKIKASNAEFVERIKSLGVSGLNAWTGKHDDKDWETEGFRSGTYGFQNFIYVATHTKKEPDSDGKKATEFTLEFAKESQLSTYKTPPDKVKTLEAKEMEEICGEVIKLADATDIFKKGFEKYNDLINSLIVTIDSAIKVADELATMESKDVPEGVQHFLSKAKMSIPKIQSAVTKLTTWMPVYNVKVGHKGLDYVQSSLSQYSK